ncbi:MAG TPA: hypothetical protein VEQ42_03960 [Pyrinomonadaceae bacterium]|nr:hypothetical protein [Pyrinomonadaceae bacterium]
MNKRAKVLIALAGVLFAGGACAWLAYGTLARDAAHALGQQEWETMLDERAAAASGGDERAVRELVETFFRGPELRGVPSLLAGPFKERLIRAEAKFRRGQGTGVSEESVVRVVEELARKFDAPEYALAETDEVRALRLSLSSLVPRLVVRQPLPAGAEPRPFWFVTKAPAFDVPASMSPVEAAYITLMMLTQKQINETYMLTKDERADIKATLGKLEDGGAGLTQEQSLIVVMALVEEKVSGAAAPRRTPEELAAHAKHVTQERGGKPQGARLVVGSSSPRVREMRAVVGRARSVGLLEGVRTAHAMLDVLGVER